MNIEIVKLGCIEYTTALDIQNRFVDEILAGKGSEKLLLLEHEPVYTIGRTRDQSSLRNPARLPFPIIETNRGGQATYHGPGQLVGYPLLDLNRRGRDLHRYLRFLEYFLIELCALQGVSASRRDGLTGVWVNDRKIASLGVGIRKWVSQHGFALNVLKTSISSFSHIIPCGLTGVEVTSLEHETGHAIDLQKIEQTAGDLFSRIIDQHLAPCSKEKNIS